MESTKPLFLLGGRIYTYCNYGNCYNIVNNNGTLYCNDHEQCCPICLERLLDNNIIDICENKHILHINCCKRLLNNKCPCCRLPLKPQVFNFIVIYNTNKIICKLKDLNKSLRDCILIKLFNYGL